MRAELANETAPEGPSSWPWRAWCSLDFDGKRYSRGQVIDEVTLANSANGHALIRGGYVRRGPAGAPLAPRAAPATFVPTPFVDPVDSAARALLAAEAKRRCGLKSAIDLVDANILMQAQRYYASSEHDDWDGSPSGQGTLRRSVHNFYETPIARARAIQKESYKK
jgi:hypothetical protein